LIVERRPATGNERQWPGKIFDDESRDYDAAMSSYVAAIQERFVHARPGRKVAVKGKSEKQALRHEEVALRIERRQVRERRKLEDAAWKAARVKRKSEKQTYRSLPPEKRQALDLAWQATRDQRRAALLAREKEDSIWQTKRQALRERAQDSPGVSGWLALLVVVDNCTRQCLGLPLFVAGRNVTTAMVVSALAAVLPPDLAFLISDQGTHFKNATFDQFARQQGFTWVLTARHRPETNGIAERFVRTLKEWLLDKTWHSVEGLAPLLSLFQTVYNNRPHQGLAIPGLSPNEFANRVWLM
jgi:transposase InsO family protein